MLRYLQRADEEASTRYCASAAAECPRRVRLLGGGGTKLGWGRPVPEPDLELCTGGLDRVLEHNAGDFTAVLQAGVPLSVAQEVLAGAGQMLALDPPLSPWGGAGDDAAIEAADAGATIGGIVATNDSGPLRQKYGGVRDLVVGITVVLSDGTIARAGGKVIKNVAGYDIGKLFAGAYGTLGLIAEVTVRLHPLPARHGHGHRSLRRPDATGRGRRRPRSRARWKRTASTCGGTPLPRRTRAPFSCGSGAPIRDRGPTRRPRSFARSAAWRSSIETDDAACWEAQRAAQRGDVVVKVSALPAALPSAIAAAQQLGATMVARAGLGLIWIQLLPGVAAHQSARPDRRPCVVAAIEAAAAVAPAPCVVLDAPTDVRAALDPWGGETGPVELMRKVKERFDPAGVCAPGLFVGGL